MYWRVSESGVSRAEEGVRACLRGISDGDLAVLRISGMGSGCGEGGGRATGAVFVGIMDMRLSRRASVGLVVRAPRPLILPDWRLLPDEVGVVARCKWALPALPLTGVFACGSGGKAGSASCVPRAS